jgi:sulfur carrier protein
MSVFEARGKNQSVIMSADQIEILLNGESKSVAREATLTSLLEELGLKAGVLVEHNDRALLPREWPEVKLAPGDRVEIIRIVAGG